MSGRLRARDPHQRWRRRLDDETRQRELASPIPGTQSDGAPEGSTPLCPHDAVTQFRCDQWPAFWPPSTWRISPVTKLVLSR